MKSCIYVRKTCFLMIFLFLTALAGCGERANDMRARMGMLDDAWLDTVLRKNVVATGGVDKWVRLQRMEAEVLATLYGTAAGRSLVSQEHVIAAVGELRIQVKSLEPEGILIEELDADGVCRVTRTEGGASMPITEATVVRGAKVRLLMLRQVMMGAAGLLEQPCKLRYLGQKRMGGRSMHMVEASEMMLGEQDAGILTVLWFDSETLLLDRLWVRYRNDLAESDSEFGYLTANISRHQKTDEGLTLPQQIEFSRSDQKRQFNKRRFMTIQYEEMRIVLEEEKKPRKKILGVF